MNLKKLIAFRAVLESNSITGAADKKTLIKFGIGFGAIILFLIIYYAILNPMVKERKVKYEDKIHKYKLLWMCHIKKLNAKARSSYGWLSLLNLSWIFK